jgi:predicted DNA-binding transcriptional regulator AlpA
MATQRRRAQRKRTQPTRLLRFHELKARGIVSNRVTLREWIENEGFPVGMQLGPRTRAWTEEEVEEWLADRPAVESHPPKAGAPAPSGGRPRNLKGQYHRNDRTNPAESSAGELAVAE